MKKIIFSLFILSTLNSFSQQYWNLKNDGSIEWSVKAGQAHRDHIEMSGKQLSAIVRYGTDSFGNMYLSRKLIFPMLRTIPNDTRGNLIKEFAGNVTDSVEIDGQKIVETPEHFSIRGILYSSSIIKKGVVAERAVFPSADKPVYIESYIVRNQTALPVSIYIPPVDSNSITDESKGVYGSYIINTKVYNAGAQNINPGESLHFWVAISARKKCEELNYYADLYELEKRKTLIDGLLDKLVLNTPDPVINRMFAFAKIRAAESIYETKEGLMHGPGGGEYYAAIWANDQAEYINPFFAYLGNSAGLASARNSYRLFAKYINPFYNPIPSSIIAEGAGYWNGAGDRGDQAMIAYGAALFALTCADTIEANNLWTLIEWCNDFLLRKKTDKGVIVSDSDELEGRFPAGKINLSTNTLAYGGFLYGARLALALGKKDIAAKWQMEAMQLKKNIESYFGGVVEGFNTYKYYEGNDKLRSWICLPLAMGIFDRKTQTQQALLSPKLWSSNGLLTQSGSTTFWDRSTLYAFRGLFKAGATDTTIKYLSLYSHERLLGRHVPYAIEAWPEGNQRHLSAESGLYCRALVEGLLGFDPSGFNTFSLAPRLPKDWQQLSLKNIYAFNTQFDILVKSVRGKYRITIIEKGKSKKVFLWNGGEPLHVTL